MINIRIVLAIVYFAFNFHPWKINKSTSINLSVYNNIENHNKTNHNNTNNNKTNHKFIGDDEFFELLRFYRPI